jgi:Tfp pilus assembly protein PilF
LRDDPEDTSLVMSLVSALEDTDADTRTEVVDQAAATLAGHPQTLVELGDALWGSSFEDCELLGVRVLVAVLRGNPDTPSAIEGIAEAVSYITRPDELEILIHEALELTRQDPTLMSAWSLWLRDHGQADRSASVARQACTGLLERLRDDSEDASLVEALVSALEGADPQTQTEVVEQATATLSRRPQTLVELGDALWSSSFEDCELLGARVFLAVLRADPETQAAIEGIASALSYIKRPDAAEPLVDEALGLTRQHPRLLSAWSLWLRDQGQSDRSASVARNACVGLLERLGDDPEDASLVHELASALERADAQTRSEVVEQAPATLSGHTQSLVDLGNALWHRSFEDCELLGARVLVAVLRADPETQAAIEGIASALTYIKRPDDAEPLVAEALELTHQDPTLMSAWSLWLRDQGQADRSASLARQACTGLLERVRDDPEDTSLVMSLVAALDAADVVTRTEVVDRAMTTLTGHPQTLVELGNALWRRSFEGCELLGMRVLVAVLRADPDTPDATEGIASALTYIRRPDDAEPLIDEALELTHQDPTLVSAWQAFLDRLRPILVVPRRSDFGQCTCSGTFERRTVEVRLNVRGETVVLEDVSQGACPSCESRVYKANVLGVIEAVMRGQPVPSAARP